MQKILSCHWCNAAALLMSTIAPCCPKMACSLTRQHVVSRILCWILSTWIISRSCRVLLSSGTQTRHTTCTRHQLFSSPYPPPGCSCLCPILDYTPFPSCHSSHWCQCCIIQCHVLSVYHQEGAGAGEKDSEREKELDRVCALSLSLSFCLMHPRTRPLAASTFLQQPKGRTNRH